MDKTKADDWQKNTDCDDDMFDTKRVTIRLSSEMYQNIAYWAKKNNITTIGFIREAIEHYIAWQNKDYDLPVLEIQRLNQLIEGYHALSSNIASLEKITVAGFDSLLSLTRGDDYLFDNDYKNNELGHNIAESGGSV